ncbi:MAG: 3-phosphoshikimate 1-carboxyvinyltransferase [Alphaproteobacteria bacterium]|nr:3-phosphoshikimate 1-carboxyvinyltransferase [Alphaproteobacteria bacterium]
MGGAADAGIRAHPSSGLSGEALAPGDKSISHRALMLAALARGESEARGLLEGDDVLRTAAALRALGASVERDRTESGNVWRIGGGEWRAPRRPLYMGNSGTGCRLLMGAVAGRGVAAAFDGDGSLRSRPMGRILEPLAKMGLASASENGRLPVRIEAARRLAGIAYVLPTPSAQIKSAVLLAGLGAEGETVIREPVPCRDHTERMLEAFGADVKTETDATGARTIRLIGGQKLRATAIAIPGDPSSAAFLVAAAVIVPGSDVLVRGVLLNPLRAGFYETLREMGADISFENRRSQSGEPVGDIRARFSALKGVEVPAARAASMIDEYPILSVVAAFAEGETYMAGVEELRVKESDRIAAVEAGLAANGVKTESGRDWLRVFGRAREVPGGGHVATLCDHRIAMSFLVMGLAARNAVEIDEASMIATSFPNFFDAMKGLGAVIEAAG